MWPAVVVLVQAALAIAPAPTMPPGTPPREASNVPKEYRAYVRCSERATRELLADVAPLQDRARSAEHMQRMRELSGEVEQRCGALLPEGAGFGAAPVDVIVG